MNFWKKLKERLFTGKVLKDYGVFCKHKSFPWWTTEYRALLTEKKEGRRVVIEQKSGMRREMNVSYHEFDLEAARRLKRIIEDILSSSNS